jgi:hypothetical protein
MLEKNNAITDTDPTEDPMPWDPLDPDDVGGADAHWDDYGTLIHDGVCS